MHSLFTDAPASECILVTDSEAATRAAIEHAVMADTDLTLFIPPAVTTQLKSEPFTASRLQQLLDDDAADIYHLEMETTETVAVFPSEIRTPAPEISEQIEVDPLTITDTETIQQLRDEYQTQKSELERAEFQFLPTAWQDLCAAIETTFGNSFLETLKTASEGAPVVGTRTDPVTFTDLYVLTSASEELTQKEASQFAETHRLVSRAAITNAATALEEAGLITRENSTVNRRGRPPKQLSLVDETLEPRDYPAVLD